jgi:hypothetical protein
LIGGFGACSDLLDVMPGLVPGIHVLRAVKDVDGRDKPGHDDYMQDDYMQMGPF